MKQDKEKEQKRSGLTSFVSELMSSQQRRHPYVYAAFGQSTSLPAGEEQLRAFYQKALEESKKPKPRMPKIVKSKAVTTLDCLPRVYLDISDKSNSLGRLIFVLHENIAPHACENFRSLCTGEKGIGASGNPLSFVRCSFHRIVRGFFCQCGDTTVGNGTGGEAIFGPTFPDEISHQLTPERRGQLMMANSGPDQCSSQFCILFAEAQWLAGRATVFGTLESGDDVLEEISKKGSDSGVPNEAVYVSNCGQLMLNHTRLEYFWTEAPHFHKKFRVTPIGV